jgi:hypothetical protein
LHITQSQMLLSFRSSNASLAVLSMTSLVIIPPCLPDGHTPVHCPHWWQRHSSMLASSICNELKSPGSFGDFLTNLLIDHYAYVSFVSIFESYGGLSNTKPFDLGKRKILPYPSR